MFHVVGTTRSALRQRLIGGVLVALAGCSDTDQAAPPNQPSEADGSAGTGGAHASGGSGPASGAAGELQPGAGGAAGKGNGGSIPSAGGAGRGATDTGGSSPGAGGASGSGGNRDVDGGQVPDSGVTVPPPPQLTWTSEGAKTPFAAIWGSGASDIYVINVAGAYHSTGDGMWKAQTPLNPAGRLTAIWGSGPTDIYISAFANVVFHSKGDGMWERQATPSGYTFRDVWGTGPANIYVGGSGMMHSTGDGSWAPAGNVTTNAIWGSSASDVYAASVGPEVYRLASNGSWDSQQTTADNLADIWGTSESDLYAIGTGKILHSTGNGRWVEQPAAVANGAILECIWAANDHAIYVGTDDGRLLYSGGDGRWFSQTVAASAGVNGIWGTNPENLYVVTAIGIYHGVKP